MSNSCTHPKTAWYNRTKSEALRFFLPQPHELFKFDKIPVPCNRCDKCQASYAMDWAVRCQMEMQMHEQNTFITLTYAEVDDVPTLKPEDFTNFMKRLRKHIYKTTKQKIRYDQCGEYGDQYHRPHHHAIIFGYDFPDLEYVGKSDKGAKMFTSETLEKIWGLGQCKVGEANMATATYIASYIGKKIYGTKDSKGEYVSGGSKNTHYTKETIDEETGEVLQNQIHKEYMTMSRMPGLGHSFYEKYKTDMFPKGHIHLKNSHGDLTKFTIPDYFYRKLAEDDPKLYLQSIKLKQERGIEYQKRQPLESTPERLRTKAQIHRKNANEKSRPMDGIKSSFHIDMEDIDRQQASDKKYQQRLKEQQASDEKYKHKIKKQNT